MSNPLYINIHSHHKPLINGEYVIRNAYLSGKWGKKSNVAYPISVGLHPWHYHTMSIEECRPKLFDQANAEQVVAIGETGIDHLIAMSISHQRKYFELHIEAALYYRKPIIIHSVRAYQEFIPYLSESSLVLIFHGFTGNIKTAEMLLRGNCYFSFGKHLFQPNGIDTYRTLDETCCFLETDNSQALHIHDIYAKASSIKQQPVEFLNQIHLSNYQNSFKRDPLLV